MLILDAILAFAVTMLVLATMGSMLVEVFTRAIGKREKGLRQMLESFMEKELGELLSAGSVGARELVDDVVENHIVPTERAWYSTVWPLNIWFDRGHSLRRMSKTEFLRRFGRTEIGLSLIRNSEIDLAAAAARISMKYEEYESAATELFRREAQTLSVLSGIFLAFAINADGLLLFNTYLENDSVRAKVIAESSALQKDVEDLSSAMDLIAAEDSDASLSIKAEVSQVSEQIEELHLSLASRGVPIGYDFLPARVCYVGTPVPADHVCASGMHIHYADGDWWLWTLRILATGLLIGLGGPFWFDAVRNLGRISQVLGTKGGAGGHTGSKGERSPVTIPERDGLEGRAVLEASTAALIPEGSVVEALESKKAAAAWQHYHAEQNPEARAGFVEARRTLAKKELRILRSMEDLWLRDSG